MSDDGPDDLHQCERFVADRVVEEGVGDVGEVAVAGEEPLELVRVRLVLTGVVPVQFEERRRGGLVAVVSVAFGDAGDEPALECFVDGFTNGTPADAGLGGQL